MGEGRRGRCGEEACKEESDEEESDVSDRCVVWYGMIVIGRKTEGNDKK